MLANGTIVNVNRDNYPDLWLSLKGGSNNFGIVTAFEVETFDQGACLIYYLPLPSVIDNI